MSGAGEVRLAGIGVRFAAQIIDVCWMLPLGMVLTTLGTFARGGQELSDGADIFLQIIAALLTLLFWVTRQATPGKILLRLRIVDAATLGHVPFQRLLVRYLGYALCGLALGIGFLAMLWSERRQGWHDRMAGTLVVQDPPA